MSIVFLQFLSGTIFLSIIFLHLIKKNFEAVIAYGIQSFAIVVVLMGSFFETNNFPLLLLILVTLIVKVIVAPLFFIKLIQKHELTFSVSSYLNLPLTLIVIASFTAVAHSQKFSSLTNIIPAHFALLSLALSAIFISLFLIVNRKGALSQALGVLSLENSIVAFVFFAGLERSPGLQMGIIFDIFVWILIATVFVSMIYKHFGSLDVTSMKHLKE
ncbi:hypothetical protein HYV57_01465 [Candidatus Peregrinibacteria bacterium]|nr:hypothetical protein [Candidatus Peregrinibacteria bacterium]